MRKQQTKQGQPSSRSPDSGKSADQQTQKNVHGEGNYAAKLSVVSEKRKQCKERVVGASDRFIAWCKARASQHRAAA